MAGSVAGGLSRVTVVTPRSRIDVALPADVPLAMLLPTVLSYAGPEVVDEGAGRGGWVLSRFDGQVLDSGRTAAQLRVRDGEVLHLSARNDAAPELVFDDVVDAVAAVTRARSGRWRTADSRRFALALGAAALVGGLVATLFSGPPQLTGGLVGLGTALILLLVATVMSRALADSRAGVLVGLLALGYAGVGGLLLLGGDHRLAELGPPHLLVAATALMLAAVFATIAVADAGPIFLGSAAAAAVLAMGAAICQVFGVGPAGGAAVVVAAAYGLLPALPMYAYRLARLPIPSLPTGPEDVRDDTETVDGPRVMAGADRAHEFLTGAMTTVAAIGAVASVVVALTGGAPGLLFAAVLACVTLLRARPYLNREHRLPALISGTVSLVAVGIGAFVVAGPLLRLVAILGGALVIAAISIGYGIFGAGGRASPVAGRALDIIEALLIVMIVPLAAWVCGLYSWIRAIHS